MHSTCLPLQVLVFTVEGKNLEGWKGIVSAQELFKGMHGLKVSVGEDHRGLSITLSCPSTCPNLIKPPR